MIDWAEIGAAASGEAGGTDPALLGDFLPTLAAACESGARLDRHQIAACRVLGGRAADQGVSLPVLVDLYLSAAWRAWRRLPAVVADDPKRIRTAGEFALRTVDDAVAAVVDGYQAALRAAATAEESTRREFVDDLLGGFGDPVGMLSRAERFGLDLSGPRLVAVVRAPRAFNDSTARVSRVSAAVAAAVGTGDFLVTTRHGLLVVVLPAGATADPHAVISKVDSPLVRVGAQRIAVGRAFPGVAGVARSYGEACDTLELADRLALPDRVVRADRLLVFRVLLRDREAITDLIDTVLTPLRRARGGAGPLLETLEAYVASGGNSTATARRLHLSVRAVTYRLERVRELTGHDPDAPEDRFVLHAALLGARALSWSAK